VDLKVFKPSRRATHLITKVAFYFFRPNITTRLVAPQTRAPDAQIHCMGLAPTVYPAVFFLFSSLRNGAEFAINRFLMPSDTAAKAHAITAPYTGDFWRIVMYDPNNVATAAEK